MRVKPPYRLALCRCLAVTLVVMYAALSLLAAACPADAVMAGEDHHHHGQANHGMAMHSLLCAWSCQANTSVEVTPSGQADQPFLPLAGLVPAAFLSVFVSSRGAIRSRAPPALLRSH